MRSLVCLAVALSMGGAACAPDRPRDQTLLPPKPKLVKVTMADYRFVYANRVPAGRVVFEVSNAGQWPHQLSLYTLTDDAPPIDEQLRAPTGVTTAPVVVMPVLGPGAGGGSFAVDLVPGARYAMASLWPSTRGVPDALLGLVTEFRAATLPPTAMTQPR